MTTFRDQAQVFEVTREQGRLTLKILLSNIHTGRKNLRQNITKSTLSSLCFHGMFIQPVSTSPCLDWSHWSTEDMPFKTNFSLMGSQIGDWDATISIQDNQKTLPKTEVGWLSSWDCLPGFATGYWLRLETEIHDWLLRFTNRLFVYLLPS